MWQRDLFDYPVIQDHQQELNDQFFQIRNKIQLHQYKIQPVIIKPVDNFRPSLENVLSVMSLTCT